MEESQEQIIVTKLINFSMDCISCGEFSDMEGGPVDDEKAKFMCPLCGTINIIKWGIDI